MFTLHDTIDETMRAELSGYDDLMAALLARRGIRTKEEAEAFLSPSYDHHIHNPMLMLDMPKAAERVAKALASKERIAVWSDYDCDGIPGGVLFHDFLKKAKANFVNYIPHRHLEGYGVNSEGIEKLAKDGVTLVITIDSGITDVEAVTRANELGMDVIVTDHHLPQEVLPPAFAILNPNARPEETYPYKSLCGSGVAWKLVCATLAVGFPEREEIPTGWEKWLLDMAGLATIADMVPLTGENRVITKYGLVVMRKSPRIGLVALLKVARVNQRFITEDDVGFMIAPRVNAASRMGDPRDAFSLFTTEDQNEAERLAKILESTNRSRRAAAAAITRAVHERIESHRDTNGVMPPVIALGDPDWRPGLLGLVANGIAEQFERPVFLWGREGNETLKGSCRSGPGKVHLLELMQAATPDTFVEFGGHAAAGGFSVLPGEVATLEKRLGDALTHLPESDTRGGQSGDLTLSINDIDTSLLSRFERLAPFGMGNPKPILCLTGVVITRVAWFGKSGEHVRVHLERRIDGLVVVPVEAITFYGRRELGKGAELLEPGGQISVLAHAERDQFTKGQPVRLRLIAVR